MIATCYAWMMANPGYTFLGVIGGVLLIYAVIAKLEGNRLDV
jgi:hypothetical protein